MPAPAAVLTDFPGVSVSGIYNTKWAAVDPSVFGKLYTGGSPVQFPDRYAAVDSASYISPEGPPTLVMTAGRDELVVPSSQDEWVEKARAAGMEVKHVTIPLAQHTYTQIAGGSIASQGHLSIGEDFLDRHLG